jgi:hypothetical protein
MSRGAKFVNVILIIEITTLIVILLFSLFRRKLHPPGSMDIYIYSLLICIAILIIILFKFRTEWKIRITLVTISLVTSIYLIEGMLEIYGSMTPHKPQWLLRMEAARKAGIPFDFRTQFQALMDLRREGKKVYYAITPSSFLNPDGYMDKEYKIHPLSSIPNKTLLACNEHGTWLTFESDEHGFRNPKGIYNKKIDIILVGDSFTEGLCVEDGNDIAGWLRKLTGMNVLNLGYGSNSSLIELATIKEYAEPFKPGFVFMIYYAGNDMESIPKEKQSPILIRYLYNKDFSQNLIKKQTIIEDILIKRHEKLLASFKKEINNGYKEPVSLTDIARLRNLRYRLGLKDECVFRFDPVFKDILVRANEMVKSWGGQFVFVYLTGIEKTLSEDRHILCRKRYYSTQREKMFPLLEKLKIPSIDIDKVLSNQENVYSLYPSFFEGHHNSKGYRLIAEEIVKFLKQNNAI